VNAISSLDAQYGNKFVYGCQDGSIKFAAGPPQQDGQSFRSVSQVDVK